MANYDAFLQPCSTLEKKSSKIEKKWSKKLWIHFTSNPLFQCNLSPVFIKDQKIHNSSFRFRFFKNTSLIRTTTTPKRVQGATHRVFRTYNKSVTDVTTSVIVVLASSFVSSLIGKLSRKEQLSGRSRNMYYIVLLKWLSNEANFCFDFSAQIYIHQVSS